MRFHGERPTADMQPPKLDEQGDAICTALERGEGWPGR